MSAKSMSRRAEIMRRQSEPEYRAPVRKIPLNIPTPDPLGPGIIKGSGTSTDPVGPGK